MHKIAIGMLCTEGAQILSSFSAHYYIEFSELNK